MLLCCCSTERKRNNAGVTCLATCKLYVKINFVDFVMQVSIIKRICGCANS